MTAGTFQTDFRDAQPLRGSQSVISTAAAKNPQLNSYTGIVYVIKVKGESFAAICETDQPSPKPPLAPKLTNQESQPVQCPVGSHLLQP